MFVISISSSIWSLRVNLKARNLAEKEVTKWKDECVRAAAANQIVMDNVREGQNNEQRGILNKSIRKGARL